MRQPTGVWMWHLYLKGLANKLRRTSKLQQHTDTFTDFSNPNQQSTDAIEPAGSRHNFCYGFKHRVDTRHKMADSRSVPAVSERDLLAQWRGMQIRAPTQELPGGERTGDRLLRLAEGKIFHLCDASFCLQLSCCNAGGHLTSSVSFWMSFFFVKRIIFEYCFVS